MAYPYNWVFDCGRWLPARELVLDKAACPLASSRVAWVRDGALKVARIPSETEFSSDSAESPDGRLRFPGGHEELGQFVHFDRDSLAIDIVDTGAERRLVLHGEAIEELKRRSPAFSSISVRFMPVDAPVTFHRDTDSWRARTAEVTFGDLVRCATALSDGPASLEVEFNVAWRWAPATIQLLFAEGAGAGNDPLVTRPAKTDRSRVVHLGFDCAAPADALLVASAETWTLVPATTPSPFRYALAGSKPCILDALLTESGPLRPLTLEIPGLPTVPLGLTHAFDWAGLAIGRYQAVMRGDDVRFDKPPSGTHETWDYGPADPLVPGDGRQSNLAWRVKDDGSLTAAVTDQLREGKLPLPWPAEPRSYIRWDSSASSRYGVFVTAVKYQGVGWNPAVHVAGNGVISWLGLVDTFEVTTLDDGATTRPAILFGSGFNLSPDFCFAAPFGGVAMCLDNLGWWAPVGKTDTASLNTDGDSWRVEGAWYLLGNDNRATRKSAVVLAAPFRFFWALDNAPIRSGPILSVVAGSRVPRLCGFVGDENGCIETLLGTVTCGSNPVAQTVFRLENGCDIPDEWPTDVKEAAAAGRRKPNQSSGTQDDGLSWNREGVEETLVVKRPSRSGPTGVFTLAGAVRL